jgi:hypothetical protein
MYLILTDDNTVYWTEYINDELTGGCEDGFCEIINVDNKTYYDGAKWVKGEEIKDIDAFIHGK